MLGLLQEDGTFARRSQDDKEKMVWLPLLDPMSQRALYPVLRRAAAPVLCYLSPGDHHQRGLTALGEKNVMTREESRYCHRRTAALP